MRNLHNTLPESASRTLRLMSVVKYNYAKCMPEIRTGLFYMRVVFSNIRQHNAHFLNVLQQCVFIVWWLNILLAFICNRTSRAPLKVAVRPSVFEYSRNLILNLRIFVELLRFSVRSNTSERFADVSALISRETLNVTEAKNACIETFIEDWAVYSCAVFFSVF